jgi:class 3 adenylate cyclase
LQAFLETLDLDIYGDLIKITSCLYDSAIPASIHISQDTNDLIPEINFPFEISQGISVKGEKHKIKTYNLKTNSLSLQ